MKEKRSENKMNRIQKYNYHVVQLLENRFDNSERIIREYVCVPKSLLQWCSPEENIVRMWFPAQYPITPEDLVKNLVKRGKQSFLSVLVHSTDNYEEAKEYINKKNLENNINKDDITLSAMVEGETSNPTSSGLKNDIENIIDALGWSVPSKSASTATPKRRASTRSDKNAHRKRSRVDESGESVDEVTGTKSPAFNKQKRARKGPNKDNGRNITDKKQPVNENASNANHSLHAESVAQQILPIFSECLKLILKLQKCLGHPIVREMLTKIINAYNSRETIPSAPIDTTEKTPELNEEERNEEQTEENDADGNICDDDDDESKMKQKSPKQLETFTLPRTYDANDSRWTLKYRGPGPGLAELVENSDQSSLPGNIYDKMDGSASSLKDTTAVVPNLNEEQTESDQYQKKVLPPEYDKNDSRWTLKYREPAPGLIELMEHSGVYVNADKLAECQKFTKDSKTFGRMLLTEIFTTSALSTCSWTSETTHVSDIHGRQKRPGLDEHAIKILLT